jgi:Na+/H+ antiporter NhaC
MCSAAILGSAVFGNHCSPIADNTVLSSMSTGCEIGSHFRTTMPYALMIGAVSLLFGFLPSGIWPWYSGFPALFVCMAVITAGLYVVGKKPEHTD